MPTVLSLVDEKFADATARGKTFTKFSVTKDKIVELRGWQQTLDLFEKHFDQVLTDLKIVYVPRQIPPGPMVIFPIRDVDGEYKYAQTKPLEGSEFFHPEKKYYYIGREPIGPRWLGNDPATIKLILQKRVVIVVEGPFDFLAARLLCPNAPIMSPLTKTLGPKHIAYLRMLGVKEVVFMYDSEVSGKGQGAAKYQSKQLQDLPYMKTSILRIAGGGDPSKVLQSPLYAKQLKKQIDTCLFGR